LATVIWDDKPTPIAWDDEKGKADLPKPKIVWNEARTKDDADAGPVKGRVVWDAPTNRGDPRLLEQMRKTGQEYDPAGPSVIEQARGYRKEVVPLLEGGRVAEALKVENPLAPAVIGATDAAAGAGGMFTQAHKAGNVNLNRIKAPDETKNVITETAEVNAPAMEAARRETISHEETADLARTMGMTADQLLKRRKGQAFNAEEAFAAREMLVKSGNDLIQLAKQAKGGSDEAKFALKEALTRHQAIQEQVAGMTAEAGRALSQFNIKAEGALRADAIKRVLTGEKDRLDDLADKLADFDDPVKAAEFAAKATKPGALDMLQELWINSLVSGPQTHVVNTLSNTLTTLWTIPETAIAAGLGVGKASGNKVYFREASAKAFGFVEGTKEGLRLAAKTLKTGDPQFEPVTKIDALRHKAIPGKAGEVVRVPTRLLAAEDDFFKAIGYRMEVNALAMRSGLDKGLKGKDLAQHIAEIKANPPDDLKLKAIKAARYLTYTSDLGHAGHAAQKLMANVPGGFLVVPFIRTPTNIAKFALERSPAAPLFKGVREKLKAGGPEGQEAMARIALGSGIGATVATLAAEGHITGGGPKEPSKRAALYATGWQPYSIKIGDKYYAYNRLEPLGMIMGIAADLGLNAGKLSSGELDEVAGAIVGSISKNLMSKTFLTGLSDAINAIEDSERYGEQYIRNLAGAAAVPTGIAQVERVVDPTLRETQSILDQIYSRIPGLSDSLPPKRDLFGKPIELGGSLGPDILSPIYMSQNENNKAAEEMVRLGMGAGGPERKIETIELSPKQYDEYSRLAGEGLQQYMETLIASKEYQGLSDDAKSKLLEKAIRKFRETAREKMIIRDEELRKAILTRRDKQKAIKDEMKSATRPK
jgi:hypothetical protein